MKVKLSTYNDIGKCAYGTLMDEFDSDRDIIRLDGKRVEINTLDDLFQFLWNIPGIASHDNVNHTSESDFHSTGTWWEHLYGESIKLHEKKIHKLEKRLANAAETRKPKLQQHLESEQESIKSLKRLINGLNEEMEKHKEMIRHENGL
jgi:hypothetical protein